MTSETPIKILLLEDNPGDVRLLREGLTEGSGATFELEVVDRLSAGLECLAKGGIDLILLDLGLPDCQGLETLAKMNVAAPHLPIVVLTGMDDENLAVLAMHTGAQDYLVKGQVDSRLLARTIRYAIERKRGDETHRALYRASIEIQEPLALERRLERLLETAQGILELDRLNVLLADPASEWLEAVACLGVEEPLEALRVPIGPEGGALAHTYLTKQPFIWDGSRPVPDELRLKPPYDAIEAFRSRTFAILPLAVEGRAIGVLGADRKRTRRPLDGPTLELLQLFAAQAALAIEHARLYEGLEVKVEERTRQLQEATRVAQEASRHKSRFLANMSHELRTPLNSILGFSQLLQGRTFGSLTEKQARHVDNIHTSGQHLLALINDLLDLSQVEAGKLELQPQSFQLREALDAALNIFLPQAEAKQQALMLDVADDLSAITADPLRVRQILFNLFVNAVKFTPAGGSITVTAKMVSNSELGVSSSQPEIRNPKPETASASEFVEIAVADTGIGIKPDDLPKLFQPFTQLEHALTRPTQGTGLGLALTKHLVELHGGTIWADSAGEGRGSTFTIRLPLTLPAS